jgi:hypothetical protein
MVVPASRRRLGLGLIALGLATILASVLFVLESANGPGTGPKSFAARRSYDLVKVEVQRTFPLALVAGLAGLGLTLFGAHLRRAGGPGS